MALLEGEISRRQFASAKGTSYGSTESRVVCILRQAIKCGAVEIKINKLALET